MIGRIFLVLLAICVVVLFCASDASAWPRGGCAGGSCSSGSCGVAVPVAVQPVIAKIVAPPVPLAPQQVACPGGKCSAAPAGHWVTRGLFGRRLVWVTD